MVSPERKKELQTIITKAQKALNKKRGVVLLEPMTDEERDELKAIILEYPTIRRFSIEYEDGSRAVVLRYHNPTMTNEEVDTLMTKALWNYRHKRYQVALGCIFNLLQNNGLGTEYYVRIAFCFYYTNRLEEALKYFTIADGIMRKNGKEFKNKKLTNVIRKIIKDSKENQENQKPIEDMESFEFEDFSDYPYNPYYGIGEFEQINNYILSTGEDIKSACAHFNLSLEETDMVILIYAREYYMQGMNQLGDKLLKAYESSTNKTAKTKRIFEEIRRNKRFYQAKPESKIPLTLILKIK